LKEKSTKSIAELEALLAIADKENKGLLKLALHDFRSPMNKLFALIGLLKMSDEPLSAEQNGYLDKMEMVISDGLSRLRNLMDLQSIEGDGIAIIYESIDLGKLVTKVIREHEQDATRKNIEIIFNEQAVPATLDVFSCLRIIDQLISNAIKFSPLRSKIVVELVDQEEDVLVQITDAGRGIADKELPHLYKKFTPLATKSTAGETTTGNGLFIASWMAKNVGGAISYNNADKSVFTLRLPKIHQT
jgi:two-component system, sensor histidine kinase LadS